jgi:hypothetical protein
MRCSEGSGLFLVAARPVLIDEPGVERLLPELATRLSVVLGMAHSLFGPWRCDFATRGGGRALLH